MKRLFSFIVGMACLATHSVGQTDVDSLTELPTSGKQQGDVVIFKGQSYIARQNSFEFTIGTDSVLGHAGYSDLSIRSYGSTSASLDGDIQVSWDTQGRGTTRVVLQASDWTSAPANLFWTVTAGDVTESFAANRRTQSGLHEYDSIHDNLTAVTSGQATVSFWTDTELSIPFKIKDAIDWTIFGFTDADSSKLDGIESGATADQTAVEVRDLLQTLMGTNRLASTAVQDIPNSITNIQYQGANIILQNVDGTAVTNAWPNPTNQITAITLTPTADGQAQEMTLYRGENDASPSILRLLRLWVAQPATRVFDAQYRTPVDSSDQVFTTATANVPVFRNIATLTGDDIEGRIVKSSTNGVARATVLTEGLANVTWMDEIQLVGRAGTDAVLVAAVTQYNEDEEEIRSWFFTKPISQIINETYAFPFTVATGFVPVNAGDYFTANFAFNSPDDTTPASFRYRLLAQHPGIDKRFEVVLASPDSITQEGANIGEGATRIQVSSADSISTTYGFWNSNQRLFDFRVPHALTNAVTDLSRDSNNPTAIELLRGHLSDARRTESLDLQPLITAGESKQAFDDGGYTEATGQIELQRESNSDPLSIQLPAWVDNVYLTNSPANSLAIVSRGDVQTVDLSALINSLADARITAAGGQTSANVLALTASSMTNVVLNDNVFTFTHRDGNTQTETFPKWFMPDSNAVILRNDQGTDIRWDDLIRALGTATRNGRDSIIWNTIDSDVEMVFSPRGEAWTLTTVPSSGGNLLTISDNDSPPRTSSVLIPNPVLPTDTLSITNLTFDSATSSLGLVRRGTDGTLGLPFPTALSRVGQTVTLTLGGGAAPLSFSLPESTAANGFGRTCDPDTLLGPVQLAGNFLRFQRESGGTLQVDLSSIASGDALTLSGLATLLNTATTTSNHDPTHSLIMVTSGGVVNRITPNDLATSTRANLISNSPLTANSSSTASTTQGASRQAIERALAAVQGSGGGITFNTNRLNPAGGAAGYVLKKDSTADYDYSWQPDLQGTGAGTGLNQAQVDARIKPFARTADTTSKMPTGTLAQPTSTLGGSAIDNSNDRVLVYDSSASDYAQSSINEFAEALKTPLANRLTPDPSTYTASDDGTFPAWDTDRWVNGMFEDANGFTWTFDTSTDDWSVNYTRGPPAGGTQGQVFAKLSSNDYDYGWTNSVSGGLSIISSDDTLTGSGTPSSLLSVANPFTQIDEEKLDALRIESRDLFSTTLTVGSSAVGQWGSEGLTGFGDAAADDQGNWATFGAIAANMVSIDGTNHRIYAVFENEAGNEINLYIEGNPDLDGYELEIGDNFLAFNQVYAPYPLDTSDTGEAYSIYAWHADNIMPASGSSNVALKINRGVVEQDYVPDDGANGQILAWASGQPDWIVGTSRLIPVGGGVNQVLTKRSATDFDVEWKDAQGTTIPSGQNFPASAEIGDQFRLVDDEAVPQDHVLRARQTDSQRRTIQLTQQSGLPHQVVAYAPALLGPNASLANKVYIVYSGTPSANVASNLVFHADKLTPQTYSISTSAPTGFSHWRQVTGLTYNDVQSTHQYYVNVVFGDGTKLFPDRPYTLGFYVYTPTGWEFAPGTAAPWAVQGMPEPRTLLAVTQLIDGPGTGITVAADNAITRTPGAPVLFSPIFDLDDLDKQHGLLEVEAILRFTTRSPNTLGFDSTGLQTQRKTGFLFGSAVRGSDVYSASAQNGVVVNSWQVYDTNGDVQVGDVFLYFSRNSANQLGYWFYYDPNAGSGARNFAISANLEVAFLHNDAPGRGIPAGGDDTYVLAKASDADYDVAWVAPTAGPQGPQGEQGPAGPAGAQGIQGIQGVKGDKGDTGDAGTDGAAGATGPAGPAGPAGAQGIQGMKGDKGDPGDAGATGPAGPGLPTGGTAGQIVMKSAAGNYQTTWTNFLVDTAQLADDAVTGAKIASGTITPSNIQSFVTSGEHGQDKVIVSTQTGANTYSVSWQDRLSIPSVPSEFTDFDDTPHSYTGQAGSLLQVNSGANAMEFTATVSSNQIANNAINGGKISNGSVEQEDINIGGSSGSSGLIGYDANGLVYTNATSGTEDAVLAKASLPATGTTGDVVIVDKEHYEYLDSNRFNFTIGVSGPWRGYSTGNQFGSTTDTGLLGAITIQFATSQTVAQLYLLKAGWSYSSIPSTIYMTVSSSAGVANVTLTKQADLHSLIVLLQSTSGPSNFPTSGDAYIETWTDSARTQPYTLRRAWNRFSDLPSGGDDTQLLAKSSNNDYETEWVNADSVGGTNHEDVVEIVKDFTGQTGTTNVPGTFLLDRIPTITGDKLANNTVTGAKIGNTAGNRVARGNIEDNAIWSTEIQNGQVMNDDLANNAVDSDKVENNSLTADDLAENSVGFSELNTASAGSNGQLLSRTTDGMDWVGAAGVTGQTFSPTGFTDIHYTGQGTNSTAQVTIPTATLPFTGSSSALGITAANTAMGNTITFANAGTYSFEFRGYTRITVAAENVSPFSAALGGNVNSFLQITTFIEKHTSGNNWAVIGSTSWDSMTRGIPAGGKATRNHSSSTTVVLDAGDIIRIRYTGTHRGIAYASFRAQRDGFNNRALRIVQHPRGGTGSGGGSGLTQAQVDARVVTFTGQQTSNPNGTFNITRIPSLGSEKIDNGAITSAKLDADTTTKQTAFRNAINAASAEDVVDAFTGLEDTPGDYDGQGGKYVAVKSAADGLEFVDAPSGSGTSHADVIEIIKDYTGQTGTTNAPGDFALSRIPNLTTSELPVWDGNPTGSPPSPSYEWERDDTVIATVGQIRNSIRGAGQAITHPASGEDNGDLVSARNISQAIENAVPLGGAAGQILMKSTSGNYQTVWTNAPSGGTTLSSATQVTANVGQTTLMNDSTALEAPPVIATIPTVTVNFAGLSGDTGSTGTNVTLSEANDEFTFNSSGHYTFQFVLEVAVVDAAGGTTKLETSDGAGRIYPEAWIERQVEGSSSWNEIMHTRSRGYSKLLTAQGPSDAFIKSSNSLLISANDKIRVRAGGYEGRIQYATILARTGGLQIIRTAH